jgi:hypothetical protein
MLRTRYSSVLRAKNTKSQWRLAFGADIEMMVQTMSP